MGPRLRVLDQLRADLAISLRERRSIEVSAIRTLIGALENAEAVEVEHSSEVKTGFGHDVPRRELTDREVRDILERERSDVVNAMVRYGDLGLDDHVAEMKARLTIIERYVE